MKCVFIFALIAAGVEIFGVRTAGAIDRHWNVGSGVWASSSSWNPAGVPGVSDNAILDYFSGATGTPGRATVSSSSGALTSVTILNGGTVAFGASGSLLCGGDFVVGSSNTGGALSVFNLNPFIVYQGNLTVGANLRLGALSGNGLVNQNDGTVAVGATVWVGDSRDPVSSFLGVGTYNLGGGTLRAEQLQVGAYSGATGTFNLNGGNVNVSTLGLGQHSGAGFVVQNGGTMNVTGTAYIGHDPFGFGVGTYTLAAGTFNSAVTYIPAGSVFRYNGGVANVGQLQIFDGRVELGSGLSNVLRATSLLLRYDQGVIDLNNGAMVLTSGDVQYDLSRGYNGGLWNGAGINSSAAAAARTSAHPTALGYGFDNGVVARYTFYGDTNLDRKVDLTDFAQLAAHFNKSEFNAWPDGDFNYDNHIDLSDFSYLASNFNQSMAAATSPPAAPFGDNVPEPSVAIASVVVLAVSFGMRRTAVVVTRRSRLVACAALVCCLVSASAGATSYTWTGGGAAPKNYQDPANWSPSGVPGVSDSVIFSVNDTVTFLGNAGASSASVGNASPTLTQSGGNQLWAINNVLTVGNIGTLTLSGGLDVSPFSLVVNNEGTVVINSGSLFSTQAITTGPLNPLPGSSALGAVIVNPGGALSVANSVSLGIDGNPPNNAGSRGFLWMNGGVATLNTVHIADTQNLLNYFGDASISITNGGMVTQNIGTLSIAHTDGRGSFGTLIIAGAGSKYQLNGSVNDLVCGGASTGFGSLLITGGGLMNVPLASVTFFQHGYGKVDSGSTLSTGNTVYVTGGTLELGSGAINATGGMLVNLGGRLVRTSTSGAINLPVGATLELRNGGSLLSTAGDNFLIGNGNTLYVNSGGAVNISGGSISGGGLSSAYDANCTITLSGGTSSIYAAGTCEWGDGPNGVFRANISGGTISAYAIETSHESATSSITLSGGTLNCYGSLGILRIGTSDGTSTVSATSAAARIIVANNLEVQPRGTLTLTGGGSLTVSGSTVNVFGTADLAGGNYAFTAPSLTLGVSGGSFSGNSLSTAGQNVTMFANGGGRYNFTGSLNFAGGGLFYLIHPGTSFTAAGAATFSNASISVLSGAAANFNGGFALTPTGPNVTNIVVSDGATFSSAVTTFSGGGSFNVSGGELITTGFFTCARPLTVSNGTLICTAGLGNSGSVLINGSSVGSLSDVTSTGTFSIAGASVVTANFIRQSAVNLSEQARIISRPNGTASGVSRVSTLSFATLTPPSGVEQWDLADNALVIDYTGATPLATIQNDIKTGYNSGSWTGSGLASSTAAADHRKALGYVENAQLGLGSFMSQSIDSTTILIRCTFVGDSNLDGKVDLTDFTYLAANFNGTNKAWLQGDYNYDGSVNLTDFTFLASNFNQSLPAAASLGATVPEPSAALIAAVLMSTFAARRRAQTR